MAFKKLHPHLLEKLQELDYPNELPLQKKIISNIKSGFNLFIEAPENSGKSTALIISTLHKLNCEAFEDSPRALIIVKDKAAALELEENFKVFTRGSDIRVLTVYEERKIEMQREEIYIGVDIVICTPKRLTKIYFQNGINLNTLQLFIIEDAEFLAKVNFTTEIIRLSESISKCQYLIFTNEMDKKLEIFKSHFMRNSKVIRS